jgi:hypothetical protein
MKKLLIIVFLVVVLGCSKEKQEQVQQNLIVQAMVNGQWKVTSFKRDATDITADFAPYKFQFKENLTVEAINNGSVEKTGTWNADPTALTITSNFSNAVNPLALLNGTWMIKNTTWTSVEATQSVSAEIRTLRLDKE